MNRKWIFAGLAGLLLMTGTILAAGGVSSASGYLGVSIRDVTGEDVDALNLPAEVGAYVEGVAGESPAEECGLQEGDVILDFAGWNIQSVRQFQRIVAETPPGRSVDMAVWRAGQQTNLTARIGRREGLYSRFGPMPEIQIEKRIIPELGAAIHPFHCEGMDFHADCGRARLGIQGISLTSQMADFLGVDGHFGVLVMQVIPSTAAEKAGLKAGDVILSVNGRSVNGPVDVIRLLSDGENQIEIVRDRQVSNLTVRLGGEKPQADDTSNL